MTTPSNEALSAMLRRVLAAYMEQREHRPSNLVSEAEALLATPLNEGTVPAAVPADLMRALELGRAHARWSVDRSKDVTERRMNEHDVKRIDAAIDALATSAPPSAEAQRLVPVKPTAAMLSAGAMRIAMNAQYVGTAESKAEAVWRDMIAATHPKEQTAAQVRELLSRGRTE
jgi:hypothetical protein